MPQIELEKRKNPQWFAYECDCMKGKLVLHQFECLGFDTGVMKVQGSIWVPVEYVGFKLKCERCGKEELRKIPLDDIDWFLDYLTPYCTYNPEIREQIVWYWDDDTIRDSL